jgi:hypothetical protein
MSIINGSTKVEELKIEITGSSKTIQVRSLFIVRWNYYQHGRKFAPLCDDESQNAS